MWMLSFIVVVLKTAVKGLVPPLACHRICLYISSDIIVWFLMLTCDRTQFNVAETFSQLQFEKIKKLLFTRSLRGWLAFIFWGGKPLICPQVTHKTKVTQAKFVSSCSLGGNLIAKCNTNSLKLHIFSGYRITLNGFRTSFALSPSHIIQCISLTLPLFFSLIRSHSLSLFPLIFCSLSEELSWLDLCSKCSAI